MMFNYRPMLVSDIDAGLKLCRLAGWNQLDRDWKIFLESSPRGCRVATDERGNVVGTVTTICYDHHFSWIGMVLVDPAMRRKGIGMQLLQEALLVLNDQETVKLDATPAGREVYIKLNFADEYQLSRMHIHFVTADKLSVTKAVPMQQSDLLKVWKLDNEAFGADRRYLLNLLLEECPELAFVLNEGQRIKGYCLGRSGHNYKHIGPVVAYELEDAINLVSAALRNCMGSPAILDVNHHSTEWLQWLSSAGFAEQRPFIRMYRGPNRYPGMPEKQFAILGPEFG
jgi:predicted N-acetyltransferase YhbS